MKRIPNKILPIFIIIIFIIISNYNLYKDSNKYYTKDKIIINSNETKMINIKNNKKERYIYNLYLINNKDFINDSKIFINNKLINIYNIKNNNYILFKTSINKKSNKKITIRIEDNNKNKYSIKINRIKYNTTLINHIKDNSSNKSYFIDTDSAKEAYKFRNKYIYVGNVPNNYIYFNCKNNSVISCELFRIIGIYKDEYIKIISNRNYNYNDYNIYERNKYLVKKDNILLSINDYIDSYRKFNNKCVKNIYKCNNKSYLTPNNDEMINVNNTKKILTSNGKIKSYNKVGLYKPVILLKKDTILVGGNGSYNMPYIIK